MKKPINIEEELDKIKSLYDEIKASEDKKFILENEKKIGKINIEIKKRFSSLTKTIQLLENCYIIAETENQKLKEVYPDWRNKVDLLKRKK